MEASADLEVVGSHVLVVAHGEFDLLTIDTLFRALDQACDHGLDVVLDVADVGFMDASVLDAIKTTGKSLAGQGRRISVINATPFTVRLFDILQMRHLVASSRQ